MAGRKYKSQGFQVCNSCGKVMRGTNREKDHTINCQWRDKPNQAKALDVLYLYREFESEAIRFLMPDDQFWTTEGLHSFIACLQLGLKQKFGGEVGHLRTTISEEPQPNSSLRKSFLYLYDTVPGGTGYLRQLIRKPNDMRDIFDQALRVVRACDCQEEGHDGCYRCVFAYRNSFDQDKTSRKRGQELLSAIAHHWPQLEETGEGLSAIRLNSNFESELERKFIEAVRRYRPPSGQPLSLRKEIFNGNPGYYLKIGSLAWIIETQVSLGTGDGVETPSRADFLIRPSFKRIEHQRTERRPIAIFTDGWEYHKDRLWDDMQQRLAILRSNSFWCWSLTWEDVMATLEPDKHPHTSVAQLDSLNQHLNAQFQTARVKLYDQYQCNALSELENKSSFDWLMHYLEEPSDDSWQRWALLRTLAQSNLRSLADTAQQHQWAEHMQTMLGDLAVDDWQPPPKFMTSNIAIAEHLILHTGVDINRHKQYQPDGSMVVVHLDDLTNPQAKLFQASWNESLRLFNLYQFLPHFYAVTSGAIAQGAYPAMATLPILQSEPSSQQDDWDALKELVLEETLFPVIDHMAQHHWPLPEAGYELTDTQGKVIAETELAWPDASTQKAAIVLTKEDQTICTRAGWFTLTVEDCIDDTAKLADLEEKL